MIGVENTRYDTMRSGDGQALKETHPIRQDQEIKHEHDDVDYGNVRIKCTKGRIQIDISVAVWWSFTRLDGAQIGMDEVWDGVFAGQSSIFDQTNRAVVRGLDPDGSEYEITMVSNDR